jgi:hypothetical protein
MEHLFFPDDLRFCQSIGSAWPRDEATMEGFSLRILVFEGTQKRGRRVCSELKRNKQRSRFRQAQSFKGLVWRASYAAAEKTRILMALKIPDGSESLEQGLETIMELKILALA